MSTPAALARLQAFEITLPGFNGGTDATDDRVLWVSAPSAADVHAAAAGPGVSIYPLPEGVDPLNAGIDYILPQDRGALVAAVGQAIERASV